MLRTPGTGPASRWIFFALLLLIAQAALAAEPWDGPAFAAAPADVVRATAEIPTGKEGVTVLLSETHYAYDAA
ncbi:MAG TPA: hypothetical protein VKM72_20485, partial [Thermoanaerobaculia bacterium]|nr:hypothetical protein [Thermoanaerobaculia bacterium]